MELRQLEMFRVLAQERSFTRTAERMHCVQSNVSVQMKALETELGVRLVERFGKTIVATDHGRTLARYADQINRLLTELRTAIRGDAHPTAVTIGAPESLLSYRLPRVLEELRRQFPGVAISFRPAQYKTAWEQVEDGEIDLLFVLGTVPRRPKLEMVSLGEEPILLLVSASHRLATEPVVTPDQLSSETLLLTERGCAYRQQFLRSLARTTVQTHATIDFTSIEAIKRCAVLSMGVAVLPRMTAERELRVGKLVALHWAGPRLSTASFVAWRKGRTASPMIAGILRLLGVDPAQAGRRAPVTAVASLSRACVTP